MAESTNNPLTHGLSGTIGNVVVFRQRAGKTVVANMPKKTKVPPSKEQQQTRVEFKLANVYADSAMKDPKIKAIYELKTKPGQSARNIAIRNYFYSPEISDVNVSGYQGKAGDTIVMRVTDDVMVTGVQVQIKNSEGKLVEEGAAIVGDNGLDFVYTATTDNPEVKGSTAVITASNLPDNKAETTITL